MSLSLDPGASCVEGLKFLTYALVFAVAASVGARKGAAFGPGLAVTSAVLVAARQWRTG